MYAVSGSIACISGRFGPSTLETSQTLAGNELECTVEALQVTRAVSGDLLTTYNTAARPDEAPAAIRSRL